MRASLISAMRTPTVFVNGEAIYTCTPGDRISDVVRNSLMDHQDYDHHHKQVLDINAAILKEFGFAHGLSDPVLPRPFVSLVVPPANRYAGAHYLTNATIRQYNRLPFEDRHAWFQLVNSGIDPLGFAASTALAHRMYFKKHQEFLASTSIALTDQTAHLVDVRADRLQDSLGEVEESLAQWRAAPPGMREALKPKVDEAMETLNKRFRTEIPGLKEEMSLSGRLKNAVSDSNYARIKYASGKVSFVDNDVFLYASRIARRAKFISHGAGIAGAVLVLGEDAYDGYEAKSWEVFGKKAAVDLPAYGAGWLAGGLLVGAAALIDAPAIVVVGAAFLLSWGAEKLVKMAIHHMF